MLNVNPQRRAPRPQPRGKIRLGWVLPIIVACFALPNLARAQYVESFESWTASTADTWETQDLSGSPYNVPANAVIEVAIRNSNTSNSRFGGVRAVGSSLERRFEIHEATVGGADVVVMHVQTDSSAQIEHYSGLTTDVDFVLLGYWECGAYVELFDEFTATTTWEDEDLNAYGVGPGDVAEIVMVNAGNSNEYDAGVRTNGSSLARHVTLGSRADGYDALTMFVQADNSASATIEISGGNVGQVDFYLVGYWSVAPGDYTEAFADIGSPSADATWEDIDLTSSGAADDSIAEILLANDITGSQSELGVRADGSSVARLFDLRAENDVDADGDYGRMHALSSSAAVIEFRHEDVSDAHSFYMLGYWEGGSILSDHDAGQQTNAFTEQGTETNAELFAFEMSPCAGTVTVTDIIFRLKGVVGLVDGDWAGIELLVDDNDNGNIDAGETTSVGGAGVVSTSGLTITFSTSFNVSASTSYILRADFESLSINDEVSIDLEPGDILANRLVSGATTSITHVERCYTETFQSWTASTDDTWETQDLSGTPYNVPANAVVEVAVRNFNAALPRWGGVRAVGSSLERRRQLQKSEGTGHDTLVMHVQADASSQIQHYSDDTGDVDFALLGYWACGTYVELFDTFTAGASGSWQDQDLCSYGVRPSFAAEIVMTNDDADNEVEAGVRTNGSSLERRLNLNEAEDGGVDTATMFVEADTTANATIEVYAGSDADVDFYLVGYWSAAPRAYNELFVDIGSPSASETWEDIDLTSDGVADGAVAEFVLGNEDAFIRNEMGVRADGSSLARLLDVHRVESGGSDLGRMHVQSSMSAGIEFYHEDVTEPHTFHLVGYWDACDNSIEYAISDLGAVTASFGSLGWHINSSEIVAGFDEDGSGDPDAWESDCGSFTALGVIGGSDAEAHGINDAGMIVGWSDDGSGNRRAFTWTSGGGMTNLGTVSGRSETRAFSVNASGEVVGTAADLSSSPDNRLAFFYLPSAAYTLSAGMNSLGTLGGDQSVGMDVNDSGQVVGGAQNGNGDFRPFRWQSGTMSDLGTLGGDTSNSTHRAEAINDAGDVAGRSYTAGGDGHAFFWDGSMTDLSVLTGGTDSWAFGLNNSGVVVGTSDVTGSVYRAFVWDSVNGMRNLNNLIPTGTGWTLLRATDVNDEGFITGFGTNGSGDTRAFLLTPTCNAGGGGAAAAVFLAQGVGITDGDGVFEGSITDAAGDPLAYIELQNPEPEIKVSYELFEPKPVSVGTAFSDTRMREGFGDGVALSRTLAVATTAIQDGSSLTVGMIFWPDEIAEIDVDVADLVLYVLQPASGDTSAKWVPAGTTVGDSMPVEVGQSGYTMYGDGSVEYVAVRSSGGTFAVGKSAGANSGGGTDGGDSDGDGSDGDGSDGGDPSGRPAMCGFGMLPPLFLAALLLFAGRTRASRARAMPKSR
jgi:probable HAF family extracellular repeat protein